MVRIPWRRRDSDPEKKNVLLTGADGKTQIKNLIRININREFGDLVFQPQNGPGVYFIYYMPFDGPGRSLNYPTVIYPPPVDTADLEWVERNHLGDPSSARQAVWRRLPRARVVEFQAVDAFNFSYPMEVIATEQERDRLLAQNPSAVFLLFPEKGNQSIRMPHDLPYRWIERGANTRFVGNAHRGEFYVMQLGVYAARKSIKDLSVSFSDLRSRSGASIPRFAWTCFNTAGMQWNGEPLTKKVSVVKGDIQPLWIGLPIPENSETESYLGTIKVTDADGASSSVDVRLTVSGESIPNHGDNDPYNLSRLRWLDSRLAEDDSIVPPFIPINRDGNIINILGRSLTVGPNGFPEQICSYYTPDNTDIAEKAREILAAPISLTVIVADAPVRWESHDLQFENHLPGRVSWKVKNVSGPLTMLTHARMEFDGVVEFTVEVSSAQEIAVQDIHLEVPYLREAAVYMMGMGQKGGYRPSSFRWQWNIENNQDSIWIGDVNAGMQVQLYDDHYSRPLNTNFYRLKPLVMPASWSNNGQGGCDLVDHNKSTTMLRCYSGPRTLRAGEALHYNFRLLLTPFKPVNTCEHWNNRYYHNGAPPPAKVKATGANVINIHHATDINPYLNYPFLRAAQMKEYIEKAHALDMKVKIYYTVRELSIHAPEIFALRSFGDEIFVGGPGGGYNWLQEHLGDDYIAGWCVPDKHDATVINSGASRWHNYYVEGINWLAQNVGIDGIYLDDLAFDRVIMQRVRRVLSKNRPDALIDLHSANQYDLRDGFASSANLYMGELPYIDRLWFGEYFNYDSPPDYYLIEISGIPFGLMGEMLQGGGNPWRGMVYGMTARLGHSGDPRSLWKAWDGFGIEGSRMIGYWDPRSPVTTGREDVLATSYVKQGAAMIAIGSWAPATENIRLQIDYHLFGINPAKAIITAPAIENFQDAATFHAGDEIPIPFGRGLLLIISESTA